MPRKKSKSRSKSKVKRKKPRSTVKGRLKLRYSKNPYRKGPQISATSLPIGTVRTGNDGRKWKIKRHANGIRRWIRVAQVKRSKSRSKSKSKRKSKKR